MQANKCVHFDYWMKTLSLELLLLVFIRSIREGNFGMYVESLAEIVTWFFALDHTHYSRWLSVHIRDMMMLSEKQPGVLAEFKAGKFVICKTSIKFSAMAIDQCHEQNNALVKGSGGAIGLTGNPGALRRWTVAEPEIVPITKEFEGDRGHFVTANQQHHDQQPGVQQNFLKDVTSLVTVIDDMGNPFLEKRYDLLVLDTKNIMDASVVETVRKIKSLGLEQYKKFVEERLQQSLKPITETLSKNNLPLFSRPTIKSPSKEKLQLAALKKDCELFMRLYVACQTRGGDLDQFFSHEIQAVPPALSRGGKQRIGTKADLLHCFEFCVASKPLSTPKVDAIILDGAVVVHMLHLVQQKHFKSMQILCLDHTYPPRLTKLAVLMWSGMCICQKVSKGQPDKKEERVSEDVCPLLLQYPRAGKTFSVLMTIRQSYSNSLPNMSPV